jgi:hypothetical protein
MIEYRMLYLPQKKSDQLHFSCISFPTASFYFNIQAIRLILEKSDAEHFQVRGTLHVQVEVHHDEDSLIDAYNEIEPTVEAMQPVNITVMDSDFKPLLDIVNVKITKCSAFGRVHFTANNIKIIDSEKVKGFLIT